MTVKADSHSHHYTCTGIDTSKLKMVDARGLNISIESIRNAALEKSNDFLVVLALAGSNEHYAELVGNVAKGQHHKDSKEIFVIIYDMPERLDDPMAVIYYKGKMTLPVDYGTDKVGAGLSTLIRRVYYDHYHDQG